MLPSSSSWTLTVNNRDKVICVRNLEPAAIAQKVRLLLDSSGDKLKLEKGHPVKSTTESVRGEDEVFILRMRADWLSCLFETDERTSEATFLTFLLCTQT